MGSEIPRGDLLGGTGVPGPWAPQHADPTGGSELSSLGSVQPKAVPGHLSCFLRRTHNPHPSTRHQVRSAGGNLSAGQRQTSRCSYFVTKMSSSIPLDRPLTAGNHQTQHSESAYEPFGNPSRKNTCFLVVKIPTATC